MGAAKKFETWLEDIDAILGSRIGLSHRDLADQPYADWFESEMSPEDAVEEIMDYEGFVE